MKIPPLRTVISKGRQTVRNIKTRYMTPDMLENTADRLCLSFNKKTEQLKNSGFGKWVSKKFNSISKKLKLDKIKETISQFTDEIKTGFKDIRKNKRINSAINWVKEKYHAFKENPTVKKITGTIKDFFSKPEKNKA